MIRRNKIREGYDLIQPTHEQKEQMLDNIFAAASARTPAGKDVPMKHIKKKTVSILIAAVVAMLLMGSAVVLMQLDDLRIGEYTQEERAWINADGDLIPATEVTREVISLQGIADSVNQKAAKEWYEFEQNYDTSAVSDVYSAPREYDAYFVGNQEMKDKVDEIAEKYGLKLAGRGELVQDWQKELFYEALGIDSLLREDSGIKVGFSSGYFYESGNFRFGMECDVSEAGFQWEHPLWLDIQYKDKAYFDTVYFTLNADDETEQWIHTCGDGTKVLVVIARDANFGDKARIFCDRQDAFLTASIELQYFHEDDTVDTMTREDLERILDRIDFSVKPQKPDMAEAVKRLEMADKAYQEEMEARMAELGDPLRVASYKELSSNYENGQYFLTDLNVDGVEECIFWNEEGYGDVYTMIDGTTEPILEIASNTYICEDSVIETYEEIGEAYYIHGYLKMEGSDLVWLDRLVYDRANGEWSNSSDGIIQDEEIDQEEAEKIMASYVRIEVEKKPVSEMQ